MRGLEMRPKRSRGECEGIRLRGACALGLVTPALGRRRGSARRHYGLLPGAWLTEACSALSGAADALARKAEPAPAWKVNRTGHAKRGPPP